MTIPLISDATALAKHMRKATVNARRLSFKSHLGGALDAVYEVYVGMLALDKIRLSYVLKLAGGAPKGILRFPLKPASKKKFPYVTASLNNIVVFQVCFGTEYKNAAGTTFAPDISIQTASSPLNPNCSDVVFAWDCKYHDSVSQRLPRDEVAALAFFVGTALKPTGACVAPFKSPAIWPCGNAVVTNVDQSTLTDSDLSVAGVFEVYGVRPKSTPNCRP